MRSGKSGEAGSWAEAFEALEPRQLLSSVAHAARSHAPPSHGSSSRAPAMPSLSSVTSWVYQLQNINLKAIAKTQFNLAVIDYSEDGSDQEAFSRRQIHRLEASGAHGKVVLAYMSIGQAENYRFYWNSAWTNGVNGKPSANAPSWLGPEDREWAGNYYVKYWEPAWQQIIYSYIDKVIANGFDGVYLDCVDAFQYWWPGGPSGLNFANAEVDMADFVESIASYARSIDPGFQIFVQNAEEIGAAFPGYIADVDGIGEEDTWFDGNTPIDPTDAGYTIKNLKRFKKAGKLVLCIDYVTKQNLINAFYADAQAQGFVPYASDLNLDRLTINPGHVPT